MAAAEFNKDNTTNRYKADMDKSIEAFEKQLSVLRTGRATPAILDIVKVDYYGTPTPIAQVASVTVAEGQTLVIKPYDASIIKNIEKAIVASNIGINPTNDGKLLRLVVLGMTEDKRKKLATEVAQIAEKAKTTIRNLRRDTNKTVETAQKDKQLSEDEAHQLKDKIQNLLKEYENKIISIEKKKVDEILNF